MNDKKVYARQLDIVQPTELDFPIVVVGAGGIGSWTTLALAKMGCRNITVVDFDKVEIHNTPSQIYKPDQLKEYKVHALRSIVDDLTCVDIVPIHQHFQKWYKKDYPAKIFICGVDSLDQRRVIWNKIIKESNLDFDMYIDARMAGDLLRIIVTSPLDLNSMKRYAQTLDPKKKPHPDSCTARSISYNTFLCGGLLANIVKRYAKKEQIRTDIVFDITNLEIM